MVRQQKKKNYLTFLLLCYLCISVAVEQSFRASAIDYSIRTTAFSPPLGGPAPDNRLAEPRRVQVDSAGDAIVNPPQECQAIGLVQRVRLDQVFPLPTC